MVGIGINLGVQNVRIREGQGMEFVAPYWKSECACSGSEWSCDKKYRKGVKSAISERSR